MIKYTKTVYPEVVGGEIVKVPVTVGVGTTLYVRSESEQIMSDIWEYVTKAFYWDTESKIIREKWLDNDVVVEVDADYDAILPEIEKIQFEKFLQHEIASEKDKSLLPDVHGREVRVVKGRDKDAKGKVGKVVVVKAMEYNMGYRGVLTNKLGIALDDEMGTYVGKNGKTYPCHKNMIWVWAHNCEVVDPVVDLSSAETQAKNRTVSFMSNLKSLIESGKKNFKNW